MRDPAVQAKARQAAQAARQMARTPEAQRCQALEAFAQLLDERRDEVEAANQADQQAADKLLEAGELTQALVDRLKLQGPKLDQAIAGVRAVAELPDPLGRVVRATRLDEGLELAQRTVPIGTIACAFESRPDAGVQMAALSIKSGNAILLKGGSEAKRSNAIVAELAREALSQAGLPPAAVTPLEDRAELQALLDMDEHVDLLIPRGSKGFVRLCQENTRIPVLGHTDGVCHTYVDAAADLDEALEVCLDAKTDYPAACNATECFLIHQAVARDFVPRLVDALAARGVEVRGSPAACNLDRRVQPASEEDWGKEYGDLACALCLVGSADEAIDYISEHGSGHTEAILTEDEAIAQRFLDGVDAAGVYWNASTRFADGYRYGLGAEVGISTGKIHARGPVGLEGLTTTKWILVGRGHTAGAYQGEHARGFLHEPIDPEDAPGGR